MTPTSSGGVARFTLQNTGSRYGAGVAQAYVGMPSSTGEPPRQLKGYQKVWLEPGQSKTVSIPLPETSFAHWDTASGDWVVTPGNYTVYVGDSSASLPLQGTLSRSAAQLPAGAY
ncbi:MAG: fibronectin type III-like domain-contianing protein [Solirubrobacteraceae bacterium]